MAEMAAAGLREFEIRTLHKSRKNSFEFFPFLSNYTQEYRTKDFRACK